MAYDYSDGLPGDSLRRYNQKLAVIGLDSSNCPYKHPADSWRNDPSDWPDVEYPDVYNYLVHTPGIFTQQAMMNYRSLEAHRFFTSGWVQTIFHKKVGHHMLLKADVKPSWRVTESPHHPWIATTVDGVVVAAHCDCMAGLGESCSHIAALLFKMEAAVRMGYTSTACTEDLCKWNSCFVDNIQPCPVASIEFYSEGAKERHRTPHKRKRKESGPATPEEQSTLLGMLAGCTEPTKVIGLSAFSQYAPNFIPSATAPENPSLPPTLRKLYDANNISLSAQDMSSLCDRTFSSLSITDAQLELIDQSTQAQSSSLIWHDQRAGRITGSTAHQALRTSLVNPAPSLIKKICIPHPEPINAPALIWGREHELRAIQTYTTLFEEDHFDDMVTRAGFIIFKDHPFLGASPDGKVSCTCCGKGIVEVKCPYRHRMQTVQEALADKDFCLDAELTLKKSHSYYTQIQLQIAACNVEYCDFVVWTPRSIHVDRVAKDNDFIDAMVQRLTTLWKTAILPELLTRRLEKDTTPPPPVPSSEDKLYCVCRSADGTGEMVSCDRCDEWFHPKCLKLTRLPRSKTWYCPPCRKIRK
ncbi:uncharacterized protein LOC129270480 [Lytechinus pictus]|uniref:uncharacterized protein LOC129270480 n=1 Tax=Lytechinus pictus TaxID=7653 RepID=UPI0030B9F9DC